MPNSSKHTPLTVLVGRLARRRLRVQVVWGMLWALLGMAALAALLGGRFSERTTVLALAAGIVAAVVAVCVFWRSSRRTAQLRRFCREFQRDFPEDRDALETADGATDISSFTPIFPCALLLGNERFGLDPDVVAMADEVLVIPSHGMKNSLNVVSAFAVAGAFFRR